MSTRATDVEHGDLAAGRRASPTPGALAACARDAVVAALDACDGALAAWEAGSAAFGRADLSSDLDVGVICTEGRGTEVLDAIEYELRQVERELAVWDVGESAFGVQRFWRPAAHVASPAICMVDVSAIEFDAQRELWRELLLPERHGGAIALHDPDGVLARCRAESTFDAAAHRDAIRSEIARFRARAAMFHDFPDKELERGRPLDARGMYDAMVVTPLLSLLGMVHRPLRFGFGLRYLHEELPESVVERLLPLVHPAQEQLSDCARVARRWIDDLLEAIDVDALPIEQHAAQMRESFGA